jgi:hypothetical protein
MRLAWVTCQSLPEPDHDEKLALTYLNENGIEAAAQPWDGPVDWAQFDVALLRSPWNYHLSPNAFLEWISTVSALTKLINPAEVVEWNVDKAYLFELEAQGVPIVPTATSLNREWSTFVIKPRISAGSYMTRVFSARQSEEADEFMAQVANPIVQPFMESVDGEGERSIIWIGGAFTHSIRKNPRFDDGEESVSEAYSPTSEEIQLATMALQAAPDGLSYARIDVMRDVDGTLCLSELELIEPSLFLKQNPEALGNLVSAVCAS